MSALTFTVEIEAMTEKSVTVKITKSGPDVRMGHNMMRGLIASALCDQDLDLDYKVAARLTQAQTQWNPRTKEYDTWGWKIDKVSETERRVTLSFPDEANDLFKKQPDGSYAASFGDLFGRK